METKGIFFFVDCENTLDFYVIICQASSLWVLAPFDEDGPWCVALVASNLDFLHDVEIHYPWCVSFPCWKLSIC
jgi:hypothetical protein